MPVKIWWLCTYMSTAAACHTAHGDEPATWAVVTSTEARNGAWAMLGFLAGEVVTDAAA